MYIHVRNEYTYSEQQADGYFSFHCRMWSIKLAHKMLGMSSLCLVDLYLEDATYILWTVELTDNRVTRANDVVAALIKRLAHRNANVQLYTLEVSWF